MQALNPEFDLSPFDIKAEAEALQSSDLDRELADALVDPQQNYPKPDAVVTLCNQGVEVPIFTRQSISGIIGKAKGGKTSLTAMITASVLCGFCGDGDLSLSSDTRGKVLYFDTEQGKYYGSMTVYRIGKLADRLDRLRYYDLRQHTPNKRIALIKHAISTAGEISLIIIDGGRDIIFDINDPEQAITTITELMSLSVEYNTHITVILHQNKGDMNARGHFGTELVNKSETVISVNKSAEDANISIVEPEQTRGLAFNSFSIERDDEGVPFLAPFVPKTSDKLRDKMPDDLTNSQVFGIVSKAFMSAPGDGWKYNQLRIELIQAIAEETGKQPSKATAEVWVQLLQSKGFIIHNGEKTSKARYTQETKLKHIPLVPGQDTGQDKLTP